MFVQNAYQFVCYQCHFFTDQNFYNFCYNLQVCLKLREYYWWIGGEVNLKDKNKEIIKFRNWKKHGVYYSIGFKLHTHFDFLLFNRNSYKKK